MRNKIESAIIVRHSSKGYTATLRFSNEKYDKIFSHANKYFLYELTESYITRVTQQRSRNNKIREW